MYSPRVAIINYGAGNHVSVHNAFSWLGAECSVVQEPKALKSFSHLVLPGVGSFRKASESLRASGMFYEIKDSVTRGKPILGICLGMQLLMSRSSEDGETNGLNLISGDIDIFDVDPYSAVKVPHVGFNSVQLCGESNIFRGFNPNPDFYFTHSYRLQNSPRYSIASTTNHGKDFVSAVELNNIAGTQFHPEKSQTNGLLLLKNFLTYF